MSKTKVTVFNNVEKKRYQVDLDPHVAMIQYILKDDAIAFTHTEVPPELGGQGIASQMARFALDEAREKGYGVVPLCPFVSGYIQRHPEYEPLVLDKRAWRPFLDMLRS